MSTGEYFEASGTGVSAGRVLGGRYRLDELLASGGMGEVYRATRLHIGDEVAVKVLRAELVDNTVTRERFQREARAAARLRHPNAVVIHDFGEDPDGVAYIVMELLDGSSLRQVLDEEGPLEPARVSQWLAQMCDVLATGHQQGIVHRDLKPENVVLMLRSGAVEQLKLLDFGIAKLLDKEAEHEQREPALTKLGSFIGTPSYMSPEQCQGEPVDARSDIYSLGVVLYELLTGQLPFTAKTATGVAIKHVTEAPPPLRNARPELAAALERVVLRALEKKPELRQPTATLLAREFAEAVRGAAAATDESTSASAAPGTNTLLEPATQILPAARGTNPQKRETGLPPSYATVIGEAAARNERSENAPPPQYETAVGEAVRSEPLVSAPTPGDVLDTRQLNSAAPVEPATAVDAPDNSFAALLARLRAQPVLLAVIAVAVLAGALGWWFSIAQTETTTSGGASAINTTEPASTTAATPSATGTPLKTADGMVYIPGGVLLLNANAAGQCPTEAVTIKPFYLDRTEVTNAQYRLYLDANNAVPPPSWPGGQYAEGADDLPVTDVSWEDAANYAAWVGMRLPSEAEWEFAARGANDWLYPWGNEWRAELANAGGQQLQPVGSYPAPSSLFGALDLIGNAAEWTASDYQACAKDETRAGSSSATGNKVVRGGSYESDPKQATAVARQSFPVKRAANVSFKTIGFRCARDVQ